MKFIDEAEITNKRVVMRVDFNVSLKPDHSIADDARIKQTIPTIEFLLKSHNRLILLAHLGEPTGRDEKYSLQPVVERLKTYLPSYEITLVNDFPTQQDLFANQKENQILLLENIRFYPGEQTNDPEFSKQLAALGDVYVNDAFAVSHRKSASVVGLPALLPSYGGLLLKKEITMIGKAIKDPKKPVVAIIGGAKISTKLPLLYRLTEIADYLLLGGGIANTFLLRKGLSMGKSLVESGQEENVDKILQHAEEKHTHIVLPSDAIVAAGETDTYGEEVSMSSIPHDKAIFDIGPQTQAVFGKWIDEACTIVWNGPVGKIENTAFRRGTDFLYYAITQNEHALSVVGGGDTLAAINKKEYLEKITHISTGGGAMLEFIENGTLPGIAALESSASHT
jgi:phosphoglycerate kinase